MKYYHIVFGREHFCEPVPLYICDSQEKAIELMKGLQDYLDERPVHPKRNNPFIDNAHILVKLYHKAYEQWEAPSPYSDAAEDVTNMDEIFVFKPMIVM